MNKSSAIAFAALASLGLCAPNLAAAATTLESASFSGGVQFPNVAAPFDGLASGGVFNTVSGSFVVDVTDPPASHAGFFNEALSGPFAAFHISLGNAPLVFNLANDISGNPAVQFKNGAFNGFAYESQFNLASTLYDFSISGGSWSIKSVISPGVFGSTNASGFINIGANGLTNVVIAAAPVPEPETYALMLAGLGLLGFVRRVKAKEVAGSGSVAA